MILSVMVGVGRPGTGLIWTRPIVASYLDLTELCCTLIFDLLVLSISARPLKDVHSFSLISYSASKSHLGPKDK